MLFTVKQAAGVLGMSERALRDWMLQEDFPFRILKAGNTVRLQLQGDPPVRRAGRCPARARLVAHAGGGRRAAADP